MAVLKKIKFGTGAATPIAQTVVTAASESVLSVVGTNTGLDEGDNPSYAVDLNIDNATLTKDSSGQQAVLKVGTVPAAQVSVADEGGKLTTTNVEAALSELKDDIVDVISNGKTYSIVDNTQSEQSLPTNVLKRYRLQQTVGSTNTLVGDPIDILKDNSLLAAKLSTIDATWDGSAIADGTGAEALVLVYKDANGDTQVIPIDVSAFLKESEFGDGLQVTNGVVSAKLGQGLEFGSETGENVKQSIKVKIDSTSEKDSQSTPADFLTVGANGVKIQGIKNEIDRKINALDFTTDAAEAGKYVAAIEETDGVVAVKTRANVSEAVLNNYAKGSEATAVAATDTVNQAISKLENQVDAAKAAATSGITAAIEALDFTDTAVAGQYVSKVDETDGVVSVTRANVSDAVLTGYTKGSAPASTAIAATDDVKGAIAKLEHQVDAAKAAAEAGHSAVAKDTNANHLTLTESKNTTTGQKTYTIGESDIASAQALANEITRAKQAEAAIDTAVGLTKAADPGETRTFNPTTNYGGTGASAATSVMDNMQKLDTQLKTVSDSLAAIQYSVSGTELTFYGMTEHA